MREFPEDERRAWLAAAESAGVRVYGPEVTPYTAGWRAGYDFALARAEAAEAEAARLRAAGDKMADCIEFFWQPSPCEHAVNDCGACEVQRWALLQEAAQEYRAILAGDRGAASAGEG